MLESPTVSVSALLVRVAVLSVSLHAIKGLLGALLGLFHELVLLALLAGLDVGGSLVLGKERSWDGGLILALHHRVAKLGDGRLLLILLVANDVGTSSVDDHGAHLCDHGHGVDSGFGGACGSRAGCGTGRCRLLRHHLWSVRGNILLLLRHEAELVLLILELAFDQGFLHLEALELLLL